MKNILKYLLIVFASFQGIAQNYVQLDAFDVNRLPITVEEMAELQANATTLVSAFPTEFQQKFKVYDVGNYYINSSTKEGYKPDIELVKSKIPTDFYVLFFKELSGSNINKIWIYLKLPDTGVFECVKKTKKELIENKLISKSDTLLKINNNDFVSKEIEIIKELNAIINNIVNNDCCTFDSKEVIGLLMENNFIAVPVESFEDVNNAYNQYDYAKVKINGMDFAATANNLINTFPGSTKRTFITKNQNICSGNKFDEARLLYEGDLTDDDTWFHLWVSDDGKQKYLFIRNETYIEGDADYDEVLTLTNENAERSSSFFLIDPVNSLIYSTTNEFTLPSSPNSVNKDIGQIPSYIVKNNGETFQSIVGLFEYDFSVSDLQRWNPHLNGNNLKYLDRVTIFLDDYLEQEREMTIGLPLPKFSNLSNYKFNSNISTIKSELKANNLNPELLYVPTSLTPVLFKDVGKDLARALKPVPEVLPPLETEFIFPSTLVKTASVIGLVLVPTVVNAPTPLTFDRINPGNLELMKQIYKFDGVIPQVLTRNPSDDVYKGVLKYVTYTKYKPNDNSVIGPGLMKSRVYSGRTRGYASPCAIVKKRDNVGHRTLKSGYEAAKLDSWVRAQLSIIQRHFDPAYMFMRGREQAIIDGVGRSFSKVNISETRSGNSINGIDEKPLMGATWREGCLLFAKAHPDIPSLDWDGARIWCR